MTIRIAVIGAGFCGTMIACELARASVPEELVIALIDDRSQFARGVAYQTNDEGWLLNARAIQLGAVGGQPGDFSRFCRDIGIGASAETFVPRAVYGAYLEDLLDKTSASVLRNRLYRVYARAESIEPTSRDGKALLRLGNGETMLADHVILATGPVSRSTAVPAQMRDLEDHYLHDPWDVRRLYDARPGSTFALLGTGLTALDVISSLRRRVPLARFHLLSRRGLLPRSHASGPTVRPDIDLAGLLRATGARQCAALHARDTRHRRPLPARGWRLARRDRRDAPAGVHSLAVVVCAGQGAVRRARRAVLGGASPSLPGEH